MKRVFIFLITIASIFPVVTFAQSNVDISFEADPLFSEANFIPGDAVTRYVDINNTGTESVEIGTEAIFITDDDGLGEQISFEILRDSDSSSLYSGSLADFFAAGEMALDLLVAGDSERYLYSATFEPETGDLYQLTSVEFDILVGVLGEEGGGGGDGPGGGVVPRGLVIFDEAVIDTTTTTATFRWQTNFSSTSRVVYGTQPGIFDVSQSPNYGYSFSTPETDTPASINGVTEHIVFISDLTPATTYYYRVISHASPDTISFEHSFSTLGQVLGDTDGDGGEGGPPGRVLGEDDFMQGEDELLLPTLYPTETVNKLLDGLVLGDDVDTGEILEPDFSDSVLKIDEAEDCWRILGICWYWWLLLLLILIIIYYYWVESKDKDDNQQ